MRCAQHSSKINYTNKSYSDHSTNLTSAAAESCIMGMVRGFLPPAEAQHSISFSKASEKGVFILIQKKSSLDTIVTGIKNLQP